MRVRHHGEYYQVDHLIAVEPKPEIVQQWNATDGAPKIGTKARAIGQIPVCWDPDRDVAVQRAHEQFRWFAGGWSVNADLPPRPDSPRRASSSARRTSPRLCPADRTWTRSSTGVRPYWEAGFTDVALVQIGGDHQDRFIAEIAGPCWTSCAPLPADGRDPFRRARAFRKAVTSSHTVTAEPAQASYRQAATARQVGGSACVLIRTNPTGRRPSSIRSTSSMPTA